MTGLEAFNIIFNDLIPMPPEGLTTLSINLLFDLMDKVEKDLNELSKLKDIEEELGINLITFLEIILGKRTFFEKDIDGTITENNFDDDEICDLCEGYGKTWALTKEELL